jgi:hypothetical protein
MVELEVVGSGRCGTKWLATRLNEAGIATSHEGDRDDARVEVDWRLSVVDPGSRPLVPRLVLVRQPGRTIRSLATCGMFDDEVNPYFKPARRGVFTHLPTRFRHLWSAPGQDEFTRAALWYLACYRYAVWPAAAVVKVEDPRMLYEVVRLMVDLDATEHSEPVPNRKNREPSDRTLGSLPGELANEILDLSTAMGY